MPTVRPTDAKKAIETLFTFFLGACETLEAIEEGKHPIAAVTGAVKKAKKRKKKAKLAKKLLRKEKGTVDV